MCLKSINDVYHLDFKCTVRIVCKRKIKDTPFNTMLKSFGGNPGSVRGGDSSQASCYTTQSHGISCYSHEINLLIRVHQHDFFSCHTERF